MSPAIVIDANIGLAQVLPLPYSQLAARCMHIWQEGQQSLIVPTLWEYEVVSAIRKAVARAWLSPEQAFRAVNILLGLELEQISPNAQLHQRVLVWAERLGQLNAYDAQYLAVAEAMGAEFWTADQQLSNSLQASSVNWVRWIGEIEG